MDGQELILQKASSLGIINVDDIERQIEEMKRDEYLKKHEYKIWNGKDGKWYTYFPDTLKGRVLKKRNTREELEDEIVNYIKSLEKNPTIEEVFNEWNNRRLELGRISRATHMRYIVLYNRHYREFGKRRIRSIKESEFIDFLEEQVSIFNLKYKGFAGLKSLTKGFMKRAKRMGYIDYNVEYLLSEIDTSELEFNRESREDKELVFNDFESGEIMNYLKSHQDIINLGLSLMFVTGVRVGELVAMKTEDVHSNEFSAYISISRTETRYKDDDGRFVYDVKESPKTDAGIRDVIIPKDYIWIIKSIRALNPFSEYMFEDRGRRINADKIKTRLNSVCDAVGIPRRGTHAIRRTYGSILLDNNIDNKLIEGQMGHTSIVTTERFYHKNRRTNDEKSQILSNIPQLQVK